MPKAPALPCGAAHRGDYGEYPEHVAPGYLKAIEEGADFIDCDGRWAGSSFVRLCRTEARPVGSYKLLACLSSKGPQPPLQAALLYGNTTQAKEGAV